MSALLHAGLLRANHPFWRANFGRFPARSGITGTGKTGHGMLDVTKTIEESADTFFYQVAYMMGIDRIDAMLCLQFGYNDRRASDLNEV
ncbi:hypothetical protein KCP74_16220 [Salmonella enterica subsp. enterica]|nr:hypothetical protein KCP74_16220 [Salmonella enterica subsp. enterica]